MLPTPNSRNGTAVQPTSPFGAIPLLYPYLIPNPGNRAEPWLLWDVRHAPSTAKRVAPRTVVLSAVDKFKELATHPPVSCVHIAYNTNTIGMINYWGPIVVHKGEGGTVLIGEVSTVNDDETDNVFREPIGRFAQVEEDEEPFRLLVSDYRTWLA